MKNLNTDKHTEINKDKHSKNLNTDKHREFKHQQT